MEKTNENLLGCSGKQLRPILSLLVARACGGRANKDSIRYAVASELLHNATLLHDDVADQSDMRRGHPTLRSLMGPSVSVLVGDFWLVRAVKAILDTENGHERAIALFAGTLSDLAEGEMLQLQKASTCDTGFEDYISIIYRKTASLFAVTATTAAISVGADSAVEAGMTLFGRYLGLAFQMRDDIFDYMPQDASVGKPVGVDIMERKITLPLLGALENAPGENERIRNIVRNIDSELRDEVIEFVRRNGGIEYAQRVLDEYVGRAVSALQVLSPSKEKELLISLTKYIALRNK